MSCSMKESLSLSGNRIRVLETHDPSTTDLIRNVTSSDGSATYHGQWVSGLTQTTVLGVPDTELITPLTRANLITTDANTVSLRRSQRKICTAFDADSGGPVAEIPSLLKVLAKKGVSMVIMEDKEVFEPGKKVNSLAASSASQGQADPQEFANVMATFKRAKQNQGLSDVFITARIESFTCRKVIDNDAAAEAASVQKALTQALDRALIYRDAGADAIMIHSKSKKPDEVLDFLRKFREEDQETPLVVVPTTYGTTHEDKLYEAGANVFIYANHLMRAKITAVSNYIAEGKSGIAQACPPFLKETLAARNHGYLLAALQKYQQEYKVKWGRGDEAELDNFVKEALQASGLAMEDCARRLLDGKCAGAANSEILPVKELLAINGVHLSEIGRPAAPSSPSVLPGLKSSLAAGFEKLLRNATPAQ